MPELFNLRLGAGTLVTQTAQVVNDVRKMRRVYMEPKRSGDCEQRENQHRFILRGPVARAISSERRDEQLTVPGGNVSSGRNLGAAVSLDSMVCVEVPGESRRGTHECVRYVGDRMASYFRTIHARNSAAWPVAQSRNIRAGDPVISATVDVTNAG